MIAQKMDFINIFLGEGEDFLGRSGQLSSQSTGNDISGHISDIILFFLLSVFRSVGVQVVDWQQCK